MYIQLSIKDLSWEDKELVLRVLFAKMNGVAGGTSQAANQVHGNNNNSAKYRTQEPMPMPVCAKYFINLWFFYLLNHSTAFTNSFMLILCIAFLTYRCFCRRERTCPRQQEQHSTKSTLKSTGKNFLLHGFWLCISILQLSLSRFIKGYVQCEFTIQIMKFIAIKFLILLFVIPRDDSSSPPRVRSASYNSSRG